MSRLCNRVTALEAVQDTDTGLERMRAVVEVRANLFKQAIKDHAKGNLNAFEALHRQMPEIPKVALSKAERTSIAEDAAEFRRRIETIRRSMQ